MASASMITSPASSCGVLAIAALVPSDCRLAPADSPSPAFSLLRALFAEEGGLARSWGSPPELIHGGGDRARRAARAADVEDRGTPLCCGGAGRATYFLGLMSCFSCSFAMCSLFFWTGMSINRCSRASSALDRLAEVGRIFVGEVADCSLAFCSSFSLSSRIISTFHLTGVERRLAMSLSCDGGTTLPRAFSASTLSCISTFLA
mmetsp:Transcript_23048/g.70575  ORF Transcript_23048/g.70575 Transcript_23048/m.70575 type:complete len:205 (-) Transcript_23048:524-1138(-)